MNFQCQGCDRVCDWSTREPVEVTDATEVKTIGNRFCNEPACVAMETQTYGVRHPRHLGFSAALAAFGDVFARGLVWDAMETAGKAEMPIATPERIAETLAKLAAADPCSFVVNRIPADSEYAFERDVEVHPPFDIALIGWRVEGRVVLGVYVAWPPRPLLPATAMLRDPQP